MREGDEKSTDEFFLSSITFKREREIERERERGTHLEIIELSPCGEAVCILELFCAVFPQVAYDGERRRDLSCIIPSRVCYCEARDVVHPPIDYHPSVLQVIMPGHLLGRILLPLGPVLLVRASAMLHVAVVCALNLCARKRERSSSAPHLLIITVLWSKMTDTLSILLISKFSNTLSILLISNVNHGAAPPHASPRIIGFYSKKRQTKMTEQ